MKFTVSQSALSRCHDRRDERHRPLHLRSPSSPACSCAPPTGSLSSKRLTTPSRSAIASRLAWTRRGQVIHPLQDALQHRQDPAGCAGVLWRLAERQVTMASEHCPPSPSEHARCRRLPRVPHVRPRALGRAARQHPDRDGRPRLARHLDGQEPPGPQRRVHDRREQHRSASLPPTPTAWPCATPRSKPPRWRAASS